MNLRRFMSDIAFEDRLADRHEDGGEMCITNSIDAMKDVNGPRELAINSQRAEHEQVMVTVSDTGVGLPPQETDQIFHAFFTTKPHGTGMGLSISRSIVESHSGRLWAADNSSRGASFHVILPTSVDAHD
jgi:signal transduction histidine kinase